jgi:D-3-phosphoglycerate dehydrogenase / 2-oxoglutarate reductase
VSGHAAAPTCWYTIVHDGAFRSHQPVVPGPVAVAVVILLEGLHPEAVARLRAVHDVSLPADQSEAFEIARGGDVVAIITRGKRRIGADLIAAAGPSLRAVVRCGAGLDTVDIGAARQHGVTVVYAPGMNTAATAEHTLLLILAATRGLIRLDRAVRSGDWSTRETYFGAELRGQVLGVVGLGAIGTRVAELASAFGMRVIYWSRSSHDERFEGRDFESVLRAADVLTLHVALNDETRGMIGARELAMMPPSGVLVNTARGALVDQTAVADALERGTLGAYSADVMAVQPPDAQEPLLTSTQTTLTPHVAALTEATFRDVCCFAVDNALAVLGGGDPDPRSILTERRDS